MKTQHEQMIANGAALQQVMLEDLTLESMAEMHELIERIADNLALAAKSSQALGQSTSRNG